MSATKVVLGVCGSIAAYRAADLARELMRAGLSVHVCLTDSAREFVQPALFEALTGERVLESAFDEPIPGRMAHIDWAREAGAVVIAPATANVINKLAAGVADDMITTIALATTAPLVIAPAMNPTMFASEAVQASLRILAERGAMIVEPDAGLVACGETGQGRLADIASIAEAVIDATHRSNLLAGQKVLISSGPTQEPIDDVRFLTNRSSGRMGAAVARAFVAMGAEVTVVSGPVSLVYPPAARVHWVRTAAQMLEAALSEAAQCDWIVGVAAVADYRAAEPVAGKMRRSAEGISLNLVPNPDILAELAQAAKPGAHVIGFAAEPSSDLGIAQEKLARKGLEAIAHNDVSDPSIGFESANNRLTLIRRNGPPLVSETMSKFRCALWMIEALAD